MRHLAPLDAETQARVIEFAMGNLAGDEARELELHLEQCPTCADEAHRMQETVDEMHGLPTPIEPPASVWNRIRARIDNPSDVQPWKQWPDAVAEGGIVYGAASATDADWEPTAIEGIEVRALTVDRDADRTTMLVRMAAGTSYPPHRHAGPEECWVLEGDLTVGAERMRAGDFQRMETDSVHPTQSTDGGCLLLITSSLSDELIGG